MAFTPEQLEQVTPYGLMALALSYMAKLALEYIKSRKRIDPHQQVMTEFKTLRALVHEMKKGLGEVERELGELTEKHKDPKSPFATGEVLEKQETMITELALVKQSVANIERRLP